VLGSSLLSKKGPGSKGQAHGHMTGGSKKNQRTGSKPRPVVLKKHKTKFNPNWNLKVQRTYSKLLLVLS
jgi:hypothetical protein